MIKFVKKVVGFGAFLIILIGLTLLGFGFYALYKQVGLNYEDLYFNTASWLKTLLEYGLIILGALILITGIAGAKGSSQKKTSCRGCLLLTYQLGAILFFVLCTGLAIGTLIYSSDLFGEECTNKDYFELVDSQIQQAELYFCSSYCQCYITEETLNRNQTAFDGKNYTTDKNVEKKIEKIQECPDYEVNAYSAAVSILGTAEQLLHCAGWCHPSAYYIFSDINDDSFNGESCFTETKNFVESTGRILGYVLLGLGIYFGINVLFVLLICCHSEKKNKTDYLLYET
ncbi:unnamed protein product [Paramecium octaurelia]|uniref:Tetraspanin family protein n=1 Tax=Paramecium octaurelia TaxID=43137 RepID=A0A8S1S0M5_PAROT|nr:unnamed protein product [Paramecium octaurelia]